MTSVLRTDAATVPLDATLEEVFSHHIVSVRLLVVPVVSGNRYLGMLHLHDLVAVEPRPLGGGDRLRGDASGRPGR